MKVAIIPARGGSKRIPRKNIKEFCGKPMIVHVAERAREALEREGVLVRGETGAVNAAVRAGADACERVGDGLVAAHIIARPHREVEPVLPAGGSASARSTLAA